MNWDLFSITNDGIRQTERLFDTLVPEYVKIDSREIPDLVKFSFELSKTIHFYNADNKVDGNWSDLFTSDANILIILISRFDLNGTSFEFNRRKQLVISAETDLVAGESILSLIHYLRDMATRMLNMLNEFKATSNYNDVEAFVSVLDGVKEEKQFLDLALEEGEIKFGPNKYQYLDPRLEELFKRHKEIFSLKSSYREQIISSLPIFVKSFDKLFAKLNFISRACEDYVKHQHFLEKSYAPQVGLFITFLDLYMHLRKRINGLNKSHLDFYYHQLLGIKQKASKPNKVHLVIEPDDMVSKTEITPSNLFLAEIAGAETPLLYQPENYLTVSKTKIVELKTLYISNYAQIISNLKNFRDVTEVQIYKANHNILNPADLQKKGPAVLAFPVMGEDQHDLAESERTMETADPGLALASPLFYQQDGERNFHLTFFLKSSTLKGLDDYIHNFSGITGKSPERVIHELLSQAFILKYTGSDGWKKISRYRIETFNLNTAVCEIQLSFTLQHNDSAFDIYNEEFHDLGLSTKLPVLQILLNNFVEHYSYGFLKNLMIERVNIKVNIKGFKAVSLQNNVGPLSPLSPFQPFGPQPSVGSYLDIKNTNVFNKYTSNFSFRIEWLELPRIKGGFKKHYESYGKEFENENFQVEVSSYNGTSVRSASIERQKLSLFKQDKHTGLLNPLTFIKNIDFKKLEFRNKPGLTEEQINSNLAFREGAVRLELCSPGDAFGHKLFPQVFPEVILHNSRRFKKKIPLPNQPYIPLIKSIEVDFELSFSENFKEEGGDEVPLQLFHIYPFGHHSVFPGNEKKNYFLLPQFEDTGNLFIGLDNVEKNAELSLLFQVQEKSFHHTLHEPEKVKWSYLDSNQWIYFREKDILSDTTGGFINSGIIRLRMPAQMPGPNSIMKDGVFWLRASTEKNSDTQARILSVFVNGILASELKNKALTVSGSENLKPGSIKNFSQTVKGVQNVWQLFSGFGGMVEESEQKYYIRVSERLRHKNRPVQIRDILQVILEEFPEVLMAKCYSSKDEELMVVPGVNLHIVIIPKETESGSFISEQPKVSLSLLYKVKTFISGLMSPFVNIEVGNAVYERVKVVCRVVFEEYAGSDYGSLTRRFINDINQHVAPWLFGNDREIKIGGRIYKSELLMFLKNLDYVKYISAFSVVHFSARKNTEGEDLIYSISDTAVNNYDYIQGSSPASVLIPSNHHSITVENEPFYSEPTSSGIGNFFVGDEFLVSGNYEEPKKPDAETDDDDLFTLIITHNI